MILSGCGSGKTASGPSITFTRVPQATAGDPDKLDIIQGHVNGGRQGQQIVLYLKNGNWWVQPISEAPFTNIQPDSTWINTIHLGSEYAALLVDQGYRPGAELTTLPPVGNQVAAVASSKDFPSAYVVSPIVKFSGYDWRVRYAPSSRGDRQNQYSTANVWTDSAGALHLRIAKESDKWTCAEVALTRSFGYGTYSFVVRDTSNLGPNVVLSMFTWDYAGSEQNNREMAIELGTPTDSAGKNAQYVVQPFYVAANVARFSAPAGAVTHSFRWEPGKLSFQSVLGSQLKAEAKPFSDHVFTSGIPSPGVETVRMALYIFGRTENPNQKGAEVVIDKFEYLP